MGHLGTIVSQTTLDNSIFFSTTDILIISSGVIDIPTNRRDIIIQYIQQGGPVYIQGEFLSTYLPNQAFQAIVNSLGGSFSWGGTVRNPLIPMNVLGSLSTTPNNVPTLSLFHFGCEGSGDYTIENYLEFGGQYFGFIFTPPNSNYGSVITNSDQDWVRVGAENHQLMENIITYLSMNVVSVEEKHIDVPRGYALNQNYPNPFNPTTTVRYEIPKLSFVTIKVYDVLGNEIATLVNEEKAVDYYQLEFNATALPSGVYFYQLNAGEYINTKKMLLLK